MQIYIDFLKKVPGIRMVPGVYRGVRFLRRAYRLRKALRDIDCQMPFEGPIGELGLDKFELSQRSVKVLKALASKNGVSTDKRYFSVSLTTDEKEAVTELFDKISPRVRSYLSNSCFLDGINWYVSDQSEKSISENWHTDNVGNRIKVFACVNGDKSQPTHVIPSKQRIPGQKEWLFNTFSELRRWVGLTNQNDFELEYKLEHETGSVFIFDTQLLHRGSYKKAEADRVIFHMEFSVPSKHQIARGPIGTQEVNSFCFERELLEIESFSHILDPNRVCDLGTHMRYSKKQ